MAVDNPTVVQEASTASHEWKNVNAQVSALLSSILQRIPKGQEQDSEPEEEGQGQPKAKDKPRSVEIQIGKTKVFKGTEGQDPQKNTLSPAQVSALQKLVDTPSTEAGQNLDSSVQNLGRVVTVRVDKEPVLRVANGQLHNELEPDPEAWIITPEPQLEEIAQPQKQRTVPEFAIQPEAVAQPEPEKRTEALDQSVDTSKLEYSKLLLDATNRIPDYFDNEFTPEFVQNTLNNSGHQISGQTFGESIDRWVLTEAISRGIPKEQATNLVLEQSPYVQKISEYTEPKEFLRYNKSLDGYKESLNKEAEHILEKHLSAPKVTEPEQQQEQEVQTVSETLEPLGHPQPLRHQEQAKPSLIDLAQKIEDTQIEVQTEPEPMVEAKAPRQEYATEPVVEPSVTEAQTEVEEPDQQPESEPESQTITTESKTETEQQPEPQPKRSLGETLAKDFANSFDLPPETKEYFRETGAAIKEGAKAAWANLQNS